MVLVPGFRIALFMKLGPATAFLGLSVEGKSVNGVPSQYHTVNPPCICTAAKFCAVAASGKLADVSTGMMCVAGRLLKKVSWMGVPCWAMIMPPRCAGV